jgi:ABC-type protease/lipase transport system fused ATPase/permease subunit
LALNGALTGGMMIAASIIAGRALQPLEGMIEGWRSLVQTRGAYARVRATLEGLQKEKSKLRPPPPPLSIRGGDFSCVEIRQRAQIDADVRSRRHST